MAKKNQKNILIFNQYSIKQFISLIFGLLVLLTGVGLLITYYVGEYLPIRSYQFKQFSAALSAFNGFTHTSLGFIGWGIICLLLGAMIVTLVLSLSSKLEDKEKDRKARRELRLQALRQEDKEADLVEAVISTIDKENK